MNIELTVKDSPKIYTALGISDERADQLSNFFDQAVDEAISARKEGEDSTRLTDLAKRVVELSNPSTNELFYIGVKFGELSERNVMHEAMMSSLPSPADLARALLRSTEGED